MGEYSGGSRNQGRNSSALEMWYNKAYIDITSCIKQLQLVGLVYKFDGGNRITEARRIKEVRD